MCASICVSSFLSVFILFLFISGPNIELAKQKFKFLQTVAASCQNAHLSRLVGKPTMWFPNRSDTNWPVQAQKRARSLKFRI